MITVRRAGVSDVDLPIVRRSYHPPGVSDVIMPIATAAAASGHRAA